MKINMTPNDNKLYIALEGRLDTETSPELQKELGENLYAVNELTFDFEKLEYISSAGLRVMLWTIQTLGHHGTLKIINANGIIREVFEITGLSDLLL